MKKQTEPLTDRQKGNKRVILSRRELVRVHRKDTFFSIAVFTLTTIGCFFFNQMASDPTLNIAMLYTLGVFIIARYTEGYLYGVLFAVTSVLSVNFFFTYPFQNFNFSLEGYQVTFLGMLLIGIITSVMSTNMKEQQRQLAEQEKALMEAQKEKMRVNLLRAVSHDLRTPLTGIIGSSSFYLEMGDKLSEAEKRELVETIENDANWLLNMVENLLSITRIDNETAKVTKSLEAVDEVASAAVIRFKKRFPEAVVHVKVPDDLIMVMMDAMLIQQVILNILQNAQLHAKSTLPLELFIDEDEAFVYFHIRDYGIGIDEKRIATIFDGDNYHETKGETDGYKGMGIGLSICKTIITAHDGTITAKNHAEGVEFCFSLPKEKEGEEDVPKNISTDYRG